MRAPSNNRISQTSHGTSKAIDYSASPDPYVFAPEDGTVDSYQRRGSGTNDAGNALRIRGATGLHQFAHLETSYVKPGERVTKGQRIAKMGYTGYTIPKGPGGTHLHYWIQTPNGYVYPPNLINEPFGGGSAGGTMFENDEQIQAMYYLIRGKRATAPEVAGWRGKKIIDFATNQYARKEVENREAEKAQLQARIKELESRPPSGTTPTNPKAEALYNAVREAVK